MRQDEMVCRLRAELREAFETPKCTKCGCLRDTLLALREETSALTGDEADALRADIEHFLAGMAPIEYPCLGCDPCYPPAAENRFLAAAGGVLPISPAVHGACTFEVRSEGTWPMVPGEYAVLDPHNPVAVSTLASTDLPERLTRLAPRGLAIVGKTETENIGIDKLIRNSIANPCIHTLIVAGQDPRGHLSGQTLLALAAHGIDGDQRVISARGKRPFLRNVTPEEIAHFRESIELVAMIGCEDAERIAGEIQARAQAWGCNCQSPTRPIAALAAPRIRATGPKRVKLDEAGYFVILPQRESGVIIAEHYDYQDRLRHSIEGTDARSLCTTLVELGLVSQLDHAAYLGRELMRAEMSLRLDLPFVQDGA